MKVCPSCGKNYDGDVSFCPEEGARLIDMTPTQELEPDFIGSTIFGDYFIEKQLGQGGMGAVYLAKNRAIDHSIAIKVLQPENVAQEETILRFSREAKAISRLTHPNSIRVFVFGRDNDGKRVYLAMEYVDGKLLRDAIHQEQRLSELRAINIQRQALHALAEAHDFGIVHRDLKPDNIMLSSFRGVSDFVKILDFGIAKIQEREGEEQKKLTQAGTVYGTPEYLSPEQAKGKDIDHRSDLYAMGIILYEMVTGSVPFSGNTSLAILTGHVYQEPTHPQSLRPDLSQGMSEIILKALKKNANERYQTAMEFLEDLEKLEATLRGGKVQRTTYIDASEVGALFQATQAANKAQATVALDAPARDDAPKPASIDPDERRKLRAAIETQNGIIRRQRTIVVVLAVALVLLTALMALAVLLPGN